MITKAINLFVLLLLLAKVVSGQSVTPNDIFRLHTDFISVDKDGRLFQDIYYSSRQSFKGAFTLICYKYSNDLDSTIVFKKMVLHQIFKKGVATIRLDYSTYDDFTYFLPKFYEVVKKTELIPAGVYKIYIDIKSDSAEYNTVILRSIDSLLTPGSPLRRDINKALAPPDKSFMGIHLNKVTRQNAATANGSKLMGRAQHRLDKVYAQRGLTPVVSEHNGKKCTDLFYEGWFVGRYEIKENENALRQIEAQHAAVTKGLVPATPSITSSPPSMFSQMKELNKAKKDDKETTGEIGMTTSLSNGQEQYAATDNNYMELRGRIETYMMDMPVVVEGMYTTQDAHRAAKASYINVHYDLEKSKAELSNSINSYNRQFSDQASKMKNGDQFYQVALNNLTGEKARMESEIRKETGITGTGSLPGMDTAYIRQKIDSNIRSKSDTGALKQKIDSNSQADTNTSGKSALNKADSVKAAAMSKELSMKDSSDRAYKRVMAKYQRIEKIEAQLVKYKMLMAQNKNTAYFDSVLAYNKTKELGSKDPSYKQMAQQGAKLLPDGQAKSFIAGLTNFDAGIFPKDVSKYTMSGQTIKGADMGYDFGFCEAGVTVGKTEYIGRDGNLDKYTCYSARTSFKPLTGQKVSVIYYGYTPSRQMLNDQFFKNSDETDPSTPGPFEETPGVGPPIEPVEPIIEVP